jgi:hypothetical protein
MRGMNIRALGHIGECAERKRSKKPYHATDTHEEKYATRNSFFEIEQYMNKLRKLRFLTFIKNGSSTPSPQVEKKGKASTCYTQEIR